jgi:hypothetical protein
MKEPEMNDSEIKQRLRDSLESLEGADVPAFDAVWSKARKRHRKSRMRYQRFAGLAAAAAFATIAVMKWPLNGSSGVPVYLTEEDLLTSTHWLAPSDALLPQYRVDIYGELPQLIETNDLDEGSLL